MDSIKFRSVHLMDDGDGHHNFGIDGDGDGHHFKGDGRHAWYILLPLLLLYFQNWTKRTQLVLFASLRNPSCEYPALQFNF